MAAWSRREVRVGCSDISATGISLLSPIQLRKDHPFAIVLPTGRDGSSIVLACCVKQSDRVNEELHSIGAQFVSELQSADIPSGSAVTAKPARAQPPGAASKPRSLSEADAQPGVIDRIRDAIFGDSTATQAVACVSQVSSGAPPEDPNLARIRNAIIS
ncbi:hypothetical protein BH09PLA1_BH09PLA1_10440 [soil metagenome]